MQKKCPKKGEIIVQNSIINCVYHIRRKKIMSTLLHAVSNVVFGNAYFVVVIFSICGRKKRFSESSQNSMSENLIFGHFEVIFLNV